jgi:type IV pilus assembly protein PilF
MTLFKFLLISLILLLSACSQQIQDQVDEQVLIAKQQKASDLNAQLGLNYLNQNNFVLAKEKILLALQQNPNSFLANSAIAYYYEMTGNTQTAEKSYLKALSLADIKGAAQNNYAIFLCRQKRYKEAEKYFNLAISDPKYLNTAQTYENAGLCAELMPNMVKAQNFFEKALQNDPNLMKSTLALSKIYKEEGHYKKAYAYLQTYLLLDKKPSQEVLSLALELAQQVPDPQGIILYKNQLSKLRSMHQ